MSAGPASHRTHSIAAALSARDVSCFAALVTIALALGFLDGGPVAVVLVVLGVGAALVSPAAAVTAIAASVPFIHRPVGVGGGSFSLLELAICFAAFSVCVDLLANAARIRSTREIAALLRPIPTTLVAGFLVVVAAGSLFTVADPRFRPDSLREFRWVIAEPVAALLLFRWAFGRGLRGVVVAAFIGMGTIVAFAGIAQLLIGSGVVIADGVERATGPYRHPNNLGLYLERVAMLALAIAVFTRGRTKVIVAATLILTVGLAATLSRGAVLAYLVGSGLVVAMARVRHGWRWVGAGAVAALALLAAVGMDRLTDRGSSGATSSRVLIWSSSVEMIRDHPLTGVGLDQFYNQYGRRYVEPAGWPERYTSHPHNLILDFWLRLGVAGLVCLSALTALCTWLALRRPKNPSDQAVWAGAAAALVAGAVHGLLDNGFFLPDLAVMTWLMVALLESTTTSMPQGIRDA